MFRLAKFLPMLAGVLFWTSAAFPQWSDFDGQDPLNPNSNELMNPTIYYDPTSGLVSIDNAGTNGVVESADNSDLLGDDVGMISFQITANDPTIQGVLPNFIDGVAWNLPVFFNGKMQLSGAAISGAFLSVADEPVPVMQLATGLNVENFRDDNGEVSISVGVNFNRTSPGNTLFTDGDAFATGAFRIVPEPASWILAAGLAGIVLVAMRRRQ